MSVCLSAGLFFIYLFMLSFLQEKMKGKNKLVPRLLGVTKESILRVDEKTKEVCIHTMTCWVVLILHISTLSIAFQNSFVSDQIYHIM